MQPVYFNFINVGVKLKIIDTENVKVFRVLNTLLYDIILNM